MADSLIINVQGQGSTSINLLPYYTGDPSIQMKMYTTGTLTLLPTERLNALIVPTSVALSDAAASGMLNNDYSLNDNPSDGIVVFKTENNTSVTKSLTGVLNLFTLPSYNFENVKYDLHYLRKIPGSSASIVYGNDKNVYSYPHNLQGSEVSLTMEPIDDTLVRYTVAFQALNNSGDVAYTGANQPYQVGFFYSEFVRGFTSILSGKINGSPYEFGYLQTSGFAPPSNGSLVIDLPLYDPREGYSQVPGWYELYLGYKGAGGFRPTPLRISSYHQDFIDGALPLLESSIATSFEEANLKKIGEILIPADTITRDRAVIGIKDIVVNNNTYEKYGIYISPYYYSDEGIYTFSLKASETIPNYGDSIDPYSTVKYFVQFNGLEWEPISPTTRNQEYNTTGDLVPKLLVFDKELGASDGVKYLNLTTSVTSFRVKIVIDISKIQDTAVPPEIKNYKCIIFDKKQLLEL